MTASRGLTNAALALFIKHYFSIPWLREYLLNRRVQFEIENKVFDDETISDLLFAIRMCNQWFVTAKSLSEIMSRFEDLDLKRPLPIGMVPPHSSFLVISLHISLSK
jgi:hypothetical protein